MIQVTEAAILGIIQGLTEFIPISSTAHLRIIPAMLGMGDPGAAYTAVIQLGTLFSLIIYFWRDLLNFAQSSLQGLASGSPFRDENARMVWYLGVGTIPVCVFGLLFAHKIKGDFRSLYVIAGSLIVFAITLYIADRVSRRHKSIHQFDLRDALLIGLAQSVALIPGASRSGMTLTMALLLGYTRESGMRISFLLSIPAIAISGLYELYEERRALAEAGFVGLAVATIVSGIVGYMSVAFLLRYLKTHSTTAFVLYRIAMGVVILGLLRAGYLMS
ncbi:MAG TPA: undecaprenyl-diphosphatase UppP [Leptospiraceae bacterium]|nr:undecaprenyl-diphosphatase UppP [Leptospiraceae bacterium]